ncbi:hypothetical protein LSUE1_G002793 [Lachnellula suecica]|uniref:Fungal N-terminal domain-containing protein n=1 Tax=Lachnellula suecica TaxID=602035 RepID=A0A8T9CAS8_9HELO|nr:hypothetical protein LSUE1_G002793 [Lachnellula suecica]
MQQVICVMEAVQALALVKLYLSSQSQLYTRPQYFFSRRRMSFGFSIGDIVAVSQLARNIWKGFADSPDQFRAIRTDVAGLYIVLDDVARSFGSYDLTERQKSDLQTLISGCQTVLTALDVILQKYGVLESMPTGLRAKSKKAWDRLKWDQAEIVELRARLTSQTTILDAFNGSISSQVTHDIRGSLKGLDHRIETLQIGSTKQERDTIIGWLSPIEFYSQHQDFIGRRQPGTGYSS